MKPMAIGGKTVGPGCPALVVAEISANHGHDYDLTARTVRAAVEAGADAVKVQTYTADTLTIDVDSEPFRIDHGTLWDGRTLHDLYREASMPWEWQPKLKELAESLGAVFFSTPFDPTAIDFLEGMNVPCHKVASFEITDVPLIEMMADTGKPVIISTGIATEAEIEDAVAACRGRGNEHVILLKCTSSYPARLEDARLAMIPEYRKRFGVLAGLSDHTEGSEAPVIAAALGAAVIEKHFILDRTIGGPDASFSMEPDEFAAMVAAVRRAEAAVGSVDYSLTEKVRQNRKFSRSLFVVKDIAKGETFTEDHVRSIRPGNGLAPKHQAAVIGRPASRDINRGTPLGQDMVEGFAPIITESGRSS